MKELISHLFGIFGFTTMEINHDVQFFLKKNAEQVTYYLVHFIGTNQLPNYLLDDGDLKDVLPLFDLKTKELSDVGKNTSLIVCVLLNELEPDSKKHKNSMMKIEEDDYFFKKYVLPYTAQGLKGIPIVEDLKEQMNKLVLNNLSFQEFNQNIFGNETYFLAIQLFLKLPFMNIIVPTDLQFTTIEESLSKALSITELKMLSDKLAPKDFEPINWDLLKNSALNTQDNTLDNFLQKFLPDAQA